MKTEKFPTPSKEREKECKTLLNKMACVLHVQLESEKLLVQYFLGTDQEGKSMTCPEAKEYTSLFEMHGLPNHVPHGVFQTAMQEKVTNRLQTFFGHLSESKTIPLFPSAFADTYSRSELRVSPTASWNTGAHFTKSFHSEQPIFVALCTADPDVVISSSKYIVSMCNRVNRSTFQAPHRWELVLGPRSFSEANQRLTLDTGMLYLFDPVVETQSNTVVRGVPHFGLVSRSPVVVLLNSVMDNFVVTTENTRILVDRQSTVTNLTHQNAKVTRMSSKTTKWWKAGVPSMEEITDSIKSKKKPSSSS